MCSLVIAMLNESDFYRLKTQCPTFGLPDHYQDWRDEREGLLIGLAAAGMRTIQVSVDLDKFLTWVALDALALGEATLDRYAASTLYGVSSHDAFALHADRASNIRIPHIESFN